MRAFVVRCFGTKSGVDFDRVHRDLIGPALSRIGAGGGTTGEIVEAGNIREDMFEQLVAADLVVADVSVHNANVFYELGVRHAVRGRATVLIRAAIDEVPFDLLTDRYLPYQPEEPGSALEPLVEVLRATMVGERDDSPVTRLLPRFVQPSQSGLVALPRDLAEDIGQAAEAGRAGDLRLIAEEVDGLGFEEPALRAVATASARVGDDSGARKVWERLRNLQPNDLEANIALANIYRRIGNGTGADASATASEQAIERALSNKNSTKRQRAELLALRGSLSKRRWVAQWDAAPAGKRLVEALRSRELDGAYRLYKRGFNEDLNHYYSGLNALALVRIALDLQRQLPDEWRYRNQSDDAAQRRLTDLREEAHDLEVSVRAALQAELSRVERLGNVDLWLAISFAELQLLSGQDRDRVANAYSAASSPAFGPNERQSIYQQLEIYRDLGVFTDQIEHVYASIPRPPTGPEDDIAGIHPVVFAGHMLDEPNRQHPRFPAEKEQIARDAILHQLAEIQSSRGDSEQLLGIAGASNGGDLLFHEACHDLKIKSQVMLPVPELVYRASANSRQAARWADRYHQALRRAEMVAILSRNDTMPSWLLERQTYSTGQRQNRWMLHHAWATPGVERVTVLTLWNGRVGDGPGGVADLVTTAREHGAEVVTISTTKLFAIPDTAPGEEAPAASSESAVTNSHAVVPGADPEPPPPDPDVTRAWTAQQEFSAIATRIHHQIARRRTLNLLLLVAAALLGAMSAQTWLDPGWSRPLAVTAAALLAAAGFIQSRAITADLTTAWADARTASETLKSSIYLYLAQQPPYARGDRTGRLRDHLSDIVGKDPQLRVDHGPLRVATKPLPRVSDFTTYLTIRAQGQADWHRNKSAVYASRARQLRWLQLLVTGSGAVFTGIASQMPTTQLAAWTAAATTVAAAIGAHLAAGQFRRLALSYASTTIQLDDIIARATSTTRTAESQAQVTRHVEEVLATQNGGWPSTLRAML